MRPLTPWAAALAATIALTTTATAQPPTPQPVEQCLNRTLTMVWAPPDTTTAGWEVRSDDPGQWERTGPCTATPVLTRSSASPSTASDPTGRVRGSKPAR